MSNFSGKFVMESQENLGPVMLAVGLPEEMLKTMLSPNNKVTFTLSENGDGSFSSTLDYSMMKELNNTTTFKIGERVEIEKPWPMVMTITKKSDNVWCNRSEMGGKVMVTESTVHNYGISIRGTLEGTALSYREEFKKVSPKVDGFYVFESDKGMGELVKQMMPHMDVAEFDKMKVNNAVRVSETSDGVCIDERFGGLEKKVYSVKFNEEYDYCLADWNIDEKRVTIKTGPGCFKTVGKSKKDGKTWEFNMAFNDNGVAITAKMGATEASEVYKRVPDVEGTWRMVSQCGMENYLATLGVTGAQKDLMIASSASEYFTMERQAGGKLKCFTNSKFYPSEMVFKMGETYTVDMQGGLGTIEGISTEQKDTMLNVMKFQGKTVTINEVISGDFMVAEYVVDGCAASTMKVILARD